MDGGACKEHKEFIDKAAPENSVPTLFPEHIIQVYFGFERFCLVEYVI